MKIALAQLNYHIGNFEGNTRKIIDAISTAAAQGTDLIVFSELAVCGYPPLDLLEFNDFIDKCEQAVTEIKGHSLNIDVIIGAPTRNPAEHGKKLFNSALVMSKGKVIQTVNKTLLPDYDVFDESRHFEPNKNFEIIELGGHKIALTICEDMWNVLNPYKLYPMSPLEKLIDHGPEFIINISASPYDHIHFLERIEMVKINATKYKLPVFYVNQVGAQTDILFDGGSFVMDEKGGIYDEYPYFKEEVRTYDLAELLPPPGKRVESRGERVKEKIPMFHDALIMGIWDFFDKMDFEKAIIGLSGGIDSAVTLALTQKALGKENVHCLLLPSEYTSTASKEDAEKVAKNFGVSYESVSIQESMKLFQDTLSPYFKELPPDITEQNIQSRIRSIILMAFSNKFGHILLNTSNKSELAVGYSTLYGDLSGGLAVLADVYKTQVYELAEYINKDEELIPSRIITKPPSAELKPDQKDADDLPEYETLDKILFQLIEKRKPRSEILKDGFDEALVDRIISMVNYMEYKRFQTAPVLRVSPKAFGFGRRMPIVAKH